MCCRTRKNIRDGSDMISFKKARSSLIHGEEVMIIWFLLPAFGLFFALQLNEWMNKVFEVLIPGNEEWDLWKRTIMLIVLAFLLYFIAESIHEKRMTSKDQETVSELDS